MYCIYFNEYVTNGSNTQTGWAAAHIKIVGVCLLKSLISCGFFNK